MSKLKSEKYKGWTIKFEKGRFFDIDGVRAVLSKGKLSGVQMGGSKEEAFKNAKAIIDQEEISSKKVAKYGYICMTCGKTIKSGVNKDGECLRCSR